MVILTQDHSAGGSAARSVVDRAFTILATFQDGPDRQSLSEMSRRAQLPVATSFRIVQRLASWGALERDDGGLYRIGLRLWEVGTLAPRSKDLSQVARPYMQELYEGTRFAVQLAIREGCELISIEQFRPPGRASGRTHREPLVGRRYGLHSTAIGLVLLADAGEADREQVLRGPLAPYTKHTVTDPGDLRRLLPQIRERGYAISDRQATTTDFGVAAPVRVSGDTVAALSLVCARQRASIGSMVNAVRATANRIGRALSEQRLLEEW